MSNQTFSAIPTEYRGIQLKSRLEAQCAYLLDQLGWEWEYEHKSYMLPNGVSYTPDFLVRSQGLVIECRGYDSQKGRLQLEGFSDLVASGGVTEGPDCDVPLVKDFVILTGDEGATHCSIQCVDVPMFAVVHCRECGWWIASRQTNDHSLYSPVLLFCPSCIAPFLETKADHSSVDAVIVITARAGQILVNGRGVEEFRG